MVPSLDKYMGYLLSHETDSSLWNAIIINFKSQLADILYGGTGWKTLIDEVNEMLLVAKVSLTDDIVYMNSSNPLEQAVSLVAVGRYKETDSYRMYFKNYRHIGNV
ncbi:unnamed protein product [Diatraea saccharalis]|uniref:Uncharacterized protein n=1 Tax=Diatraea saccharalis TaxID=40085 RepID=A0A9N9QV46_9NEOP|nr:unnamed protein product [Diatraea saccharalis]